MTSSDKQWWWLAVNGPSCTACGFPIRPDQFEVCPVPEQLIGIRTREEQLAAQKLPTFVPETPNHQLVSRRSGLLTETTSCHTRFRTQLIIPSRNAELTTCLTSQLHLHALVGIALPVCPVFMGLGARSDA
jgi:hypothetical protein